MSAAPKISVVCPIFNGEEYLRESVESMLGQSYRDFELLLWDDGSSDHSCQIADEFRDARIRKFANERNQALFTTLNQAIAASRGKIISL